MSGERALEELAGRAFGQYSAAVRPRCEGMAMTWVETLAYVRVGVMSAKSPGLLEGLCKMTSRMSTANEMQLISNRKVQTISSRKCAFSPAENAVIHQSMPPLPTSSRSLAKSILRCTFFRAPGQVYQDLPRRQRLTWAPLGYAHLGSEF